jgi:hypothetical protein
MQQQPSQSKPVPLPTVPTPTRLTPAQLRQVSGAGPQDACLPKKGW